MRVLPALLCLAVLAGTPGSSRAAPVIVAPALLDHGSTSVGGSATQTLTIQNIGNGPLTVTSMEISGSSQFAFDSPPSVPFNVAPSGQAFITTVFSPTSRGLKQATLTIASNDPVTPSKGVTLRGVGLAPVIGATSGPVGFGEVVLPGSADRNVSVSNSGDLSLIVNGCTFSGPDSAAFSIVSALPQTVAPGSATSLSVRFTPASAGAKSATLHINSNDPITPDKLVALSGSAIDLVDVQDARVTVFALASPSPNPVAGGTVVTFTLPAAANTLLEIFDGQGRRVRTLLRAARPAGRQSVRWDARDDRGGSVRSGVYLVRLSSVGRTAISRFSVLR